MGFWAVITRFGEAQILLPACAAALLWLLFASAAGPRSLPRHGGRAAAWRWGAGLCTTTFVTTASKVAFLGFGMGWAALDFTGFSGHAMFSCAVLPVLAGVVAGRGGAFTGALLAALVVVSRVQVGAHSWSEAVSGALLGAVVAAWALRAWFEPPGPVHPPWWLPLALVAWLSVLPAHAPPPRTHDAVVRLSLWVSGRSQPYTRRQMRLESARPSQSPSTSR